MKKHRLILALCAGLACATVAVADDKAASAHQGHAGHDMAGGDAGSKKLHEQMMRGAKDSQTMQMKGDTDKDFIAMMKHHHEQGIKMAQTELDHGDDAEAKRFASKIIENQRKEIAQFEAWQKKHQ